MTRRPRRPGERPVRDELALLRGSAQALAHRNARLEARVAELERGAEARAGSLSLLWRKVEALERALRGAPRPELVPEPRTVLAPRLPLAKAAELLGVSRNHARELGEAGVLDLADMRE